MKSRLHGDARAHRADGVVFGDARHAEGDHHAVAHQLDDGAAVSLDGAAHRAVVALHQAGDGLGVELLVESRRSDQIGEDDRNDFARLGDCGRPRRLGRHRCRRGRRRRRTGHFRHRPKETLAVAHRDPELLEILLGQARHDVQVDVVGFEAVGVLPQPQLF